VKVVTGPLAGTLSGRCEVAVPVPGKVDPGCTNGFQPVWAGASHVQTFTAAARTVESVRLRLAAAGDAPGGELIIELRDPAKPEAEPLGTAVFRAEVPGAKPPPEGVAACRPTRQFEWQQAALKAAGLEPGKAYELAFSSGGTEEKSAWLVNCFYRDVYPGGEHRPGGPAEKPPAKPGAFDLVFGLAGGETKVSSVPAGTELPAKEPAGLSHEGWAPGM
jgi:hypothetical protein